MSSRVTSGYQGGNNASNSSGLRHFRFAFKGGRSHRCRFTGENEGALICKLSISSEKGAFRGTQKVRQVGIKKGFEPRGKGEPETDARGTSARNSRCRSRNRRLWIRMKRGLFRSMEGKRREIPRERLGKGKGFFSLMSRKKAETNR